MSGVKPGSRLRRFGGYVIDVERTVGLRPDHPAVVEGRTVFPSTVVSPADSPRLLVSGINNPKLGKMVTKGDRAGWPIYQLTLEERATCSRSCAQWNGCYGNSVHRARRHRADEHLIPLLDVELEQLNSKHPNGFLVRLHTLGDFFSPEYVRAWGRWLDEYPGLHVFGYTAWEPFTPIGHEVELLSNGNWDRFAIRLSGWDTVVVDAAPDRGDTILCPAQTSKTEACGTCGLCWAEGSRSKVIAFLRHGMKRTERGV